MPVISRPIYFFNSYSLCGLLVNTLDFKKPPKSSLKLEKHGSLAVSHHCTKSHDLETFTRKNTLIHSSCVHDC